MKRLVLIGLLIGSFALSGCGLAQRAELRQRQDSAKAQAAAVVADCNVKFPQGQQETVLKRIQCLNGALAIVQPIANNPDLLAQFAAYRLEVGEQMQGGKMSLAQGNALIAQKWSQIVAEDQQRTLAARSVAAQEQVGAAANTEASLALMQTGLAMMNGR